MNRTEFMSQLKRSLSKLPVEERENAISYYTEYFNDAIAGSLDQNANTSIDEERIIKELGSPSKIASQIIGNYAVSDVATSPKSAKKGLFKLVLILLILGGGLAAVGLGMGAKTGMSKSEAIATNINDKNEKSEDFLKSEGGILTIIILKYMYQKMLIFKI